MIMSKIIEKEYQSKIKEENLEAMKTKDNIKKEDLIYATTLQFSCKRKKGLS